MGRGVLVIQPDPLNLDVGVSAAPPLVVLPSEVDRVRPGREVQGQGAGLGLRIARRHCEVVRHPVAVVQAIHEDVEFKVGVTTRETPFVDGGKLNRVNAVHRDGDILPEPFPAPMGVVGAIGIDGPPAGGLLVTAQINPGVLLHLKAQIHNLPFQPGNLLIGLNHPCPPTVLILGNGIELSLELLHGRPGIDAAQEGKAGIKLGLGGIAP